MKHLTHTDTAILMCFSVAQTFPCLRASKDNPICRYRVQKNNSTTDVSSPVRFFGMSKGSALDILGFATFCTRYGAVRDNVILSEDDEEFDGWHLMINFEKGIFEHVMLSRRPCL